MPTCYKFVNRSTGEIVTLDSIDKRICEDFGRKYSTTHFSPEFQVLTFIGAHIAPILLDGVVTETNLLAYIDWSDDMTQEQENFLRKYLVNEYEFSSWQQLQTRIDVKPIGYEHKLY